MEYLWDLLVNLHWGAVGQIIMIDILLGGDNAVVIAMACRNLPHEQRAKGIFWGTAGAIGLRVVLITFAVMLLDLPFLKVVGALLLHATWTILRDSIRILLDSTPEKTDYDAVGEYIRSVKDVEEVHDLHVWTISPGHDAVQCHVLISSYQCWPRILHEIREGIKGRFGIDHVTVQPEWACMTPWWICPKNAAGEEKAKKAPIERKGH